jgi:molybdate/tungstate transport system substrate-binding protein
MKRFTIILFLVLVLTLTLIAGCTSQPTSPSDTLSGKLPIYHAGSLAIPFAQISEEFNKLYPDVEILLEGAGSATTIRKVTELGKECGVIGSADYTLIPELMFPDYADWYIIFVSNRMCIAYTDQSQFKDEINTDNWFEILQRDGVKYGRSDPNQDPCGYRTLMLWQLAEDYYTVPGVYDNLYEATGDVMRPKSVDLIALLETGDLDYAFEYSSVAVQHELNFVELPTEIDLSSNEFKDYYATAQVEIAGKEPGETMTIKGERIVYGVTIPTNFPHKEFAIAWIKFLLSEEGMAIMEANGHPPIIPAITNNLEKLPVELSSYAVEEI